MASLKQDIGNAIAECLQGNRYDIGNLGGKALEGKCQ